jgi:hypothetical protein
MQVKKLISLVSSILFVPLSLMAQGVPAGGGVAAYGSSVQTPLEFAGESRPTNQITLSTGISTLYDDNVLSRNNERVSDEALSFNSQLGISRRTENVTIDFNYLPFFMLYRQLDQFDRLNHAATLNMSFRMGAHFMLGLHDSFSYQNGVYPTLTGQQALAGSPSPVALNPFIYSPTLRTLSNTPGLDLTFMKSSQTSLTFSGNYNQRKFASQAGTGQPLYNDTSLSGSIQYQYRMTIHTTFGLRLIYQNSEYQGGGQILGSRQRSQVASTVVSVSSRLSPSVTVSFFGGPQYIRTLGQVLSGTNPPGQVEASGGGSVTKEVRKTALNLSAQRSVSDGGGIYTSVVSTSVAFGVRRRLVGRWESNWSGALADADTSLLQLGNGKTETLTGGVDFTRPFGSGGSNFRISYTTTHQLTKGTLPGLADFDRNQVTIAIDFQLKAIPVGR